MKDTLTYYNELKSVINTKDMNKFMTYLKAIPKEDLDKVLKATERDGDLSLWKYFNSTVQLGTFSRGERGDYEQQLMSKIAFLACSDYKTINTWYTPFDFFLTKENNQYLENFDEKLIEILIHRKVSWLNKWFARNRWRAIPYTTLYKLYELGLIKHDKQVFVQSLAGLPFWTHSNFSAYDYIKNNSFLIQNDLFSIFDYELHFISTVNQDLNWPGIFHKLVQDSIVEQEVILRKCIEASKKNFKRHFVNQYRELFLYLNPTIEEKLSLQNELFELLNQSLAANVNFAIDQIKTIVEQKDFDIEAFLMNIESILPRNDIKTGIKTILSIFEKIAKKHKNLNSQICQLATNCLLNPDSAIQEKAAKIIKTYGDKNDEILLSSLSMYAEQLPKTILEHLQDFSFIENQTNISAESVEYQYIPAIFPKAIEGKPLEYISNWNDLLFQVGKAMKSTDPIDAELLFDGMIRLKNQFPANYKEQLEAYIKQLHNFSSYSYIGNINKLIKDWGSSTPSEVHDYGWKNDQFIELLALRVEYIGRKVKSNSNLSLLSTPTHAPFWVSSEILVDRLLAYQEANEPFDDLDFLLAVTRIALAQSGTIIVKTNKLNGLIKDLILYLLIDNQPLTINKSSLIDNTTQTIIKYFSKLGSEIQLTEEDKQALFWAIVARTKNPYGIFKEFEETTLKNYPNIIQPYELTWNTKQWSEYTNWNSKTTTHYKLQLNSINDKLSINTLFYSLGYFRTKSAYDFIDIFADDIKSIYSLIPNFPEAFYFKMLQQYTEESTTNSNLTKEAFHESLKTLLLYGQNIDKSANLFLATGFLSNAPMNRDLSVEIFIQGINEKRLNVALLGHNIGKLLAGNYAPLQRFIDSLLALKNISAVNDAALLILFENLLVEFTEETPKSFIKLLEFYNELLLNSSKEIPISVQQKIEKWRENTSLKKQIIKMKGLLR